MNEEDMNPEDSARMILERLREGGLWQPAGLGLSYVKEGETKLSLVAQENNPTSAQARIRMRLLIESTGWEVDESAVQLTDVQHLSPQEQHMQEMMLRQEMAQSWKCQCETPLSAFPLEEGKWTHDGDEEMILPDGEKELVEQWSVVVSCPVCETTLPLEPYDYGLLAGDDAMLVYTCADDPATKSPGPAYEYRLTALSRPEIIEHMDAINSPTGSADSQSIFCTGTIFQGHLLPPHVRGAVVMVQETLITDEEE
tara:strand:- start:13638 stop:14402 length:765 start_codon:yes stop_codon:yes gene_type:complete